MENGHPVFSPRSRHDRQHRPHPLHPSIRGLQVSDQQGPLPPANVSGSEALPGDGAQLKVTQDVISRAQGRKPRSLGPLRSLLARGHSKPWAWAARPWGSDPQHHRGCCSRRGGCASHGEVIIGVTPGSDSAAHSPPPAAAHRSHGAPSFGSAVSSGRAPS